MIGIDMARRLPDGSIFMPKPAQWLLGVRTAITEIAKAARTIEMVGTVIPDPSASGRVQASLAGRIEVANGRLPHVGQHVSQGDVMALLSPSVPAFDRGTTDAQVAEIAGAIEIAEQKAKRYAGVGPGTVPQKDIDQVIAELAALKARRAALRPVGGAETLKAPVSGIVAAANVHLGPGGGRARDAVRDRRSRQAVDRGDRHRAAGRAGHPLGDGGGLGQDGAAVVHRPRPGAQAAGAAAAVSCRAADRGPGRGAAGHGAVQSKQELSGIVVPASAVVRASNGLPQVWEHVAAERFEAIAVRTAPLDGRNVLITAGVKEGTRLVIEGAEFINQVR